MSARIEQGCRKQVFGIGSNVHNQFGFLRRPFCSCSLALEVEPVGAVEPAGCGLVEPRVRPVQGWFYLARSVQDGLD